ncbi:MAG: PAS domain S-box protein [Nitrospinae bacterium]|nr:PAS domain S-box protein [Nitrospinota bacterium]MBF0634019.1 PAS domain S-box protein [Nitrospinota bacterium]
MDRELRILILEDVPEDAELVINALRRGGLAFVSKRVDTREDFTRELAEFRPGIILSDYNLPSFDGIAALKITMEKTPDIPFILVTGVMGDENAFAAMKLGCTDYVPKSKLFILPMAVNRALAEKAVRLELKRAHEATQLFKDVINQSSDAIFIIDVATSRFIDVSEKACASLGYTREELLTMGVIDIENGLPSKSDWDDHIKELKKQGVMLLEGEHRRSDGGVFPVEVNVKIVAKAEKEYMVSVARDISQRKRMEAELRKSEERFRNIVESTNDWIWEVDQNMAYVYASPQSLNILGYAPEEIIGKTPFDLMAPEESRRVASEIATAVGARLPIHNLENRNLAKDGHEVILETSGAPIFGSDGEFRGYRGVDRDITQRKQEGLKTQESERKYRALFTNITNGYAYCEMIFDERGKPFDWIYLEVNDVFERVTGLKKEDVTGKKVTEVIPGINNYKPNLFEIYGQVAMTGESSQFTIYFDIMNIWLSVLAYCPEKGYFVAIFEDITERILAEKKIRLEQARLETMLELGRIKEKPIQTVMDHAMNGCLTLTGSEIAFMGFLNEDESFMTIARCYESSPEKCYLWADSHDHSVEKAGLWAEAIRQRRPVVLNEHQAHDGKRELPFGSLELRRFLSVPAVEGGKVVALVTVGNKAEDYSEADIRQLQLLIDYVWYIAREKESERRIKESEEKFHAMAHSANDAIITIDGEDKSGIDGSIIFWNAAAERIFGYSRDEAIGKNIAIIVPPQYRDEHMAGMLKFRKTGEGPMLGKIIEMTALKKDGAEFPVELMVSGFMVNEKWHATAIIRDVTERKKWETNLKDSNAQLEEALSNLEKTQRLLIRSEKLASMGQLSAGVAHELKNPLNIISTTVQLLQMGDDAKEERDDTYKVIIEQVRRSSKIIDNLREFARERKPENVVIDVNDLLEKTISLIEYEVKSEGIELIRRFEADPVEIIGDPDQLAQVFLNIIGNARDSMNEKRRSCCMDELKKKEWTGSLSISAILEGSYIEIRFADNGVGIPLKHMGKVFDPFFTTKEEGKGTGLGLGIAYGIVQNHGGTMTVESEEGEGAAFTVALPVSSNSTVSGVD